MLTGAPSLHSRRPEGLRRAGQCGPCPPAHGLLSDGAAVLVLTIRVHLSAAGPGSSMVHPREDRLVEISLHLGAADPRREWTAVDVLFDRLAGLDVGRATLTICVRTPDPRGRTRTFTTMAAPLRVMRAGRAGRARGDAGGDGVDLHLREGA